MACGSTVTITDRAAYAVRACEGEWAHEDDHASGPFRWQRLDQSTGEPATETSTPPDQPTDPTPPEPAPGTGETPPAPAEGDTTP